MWECGVWYRKALILPGVVENYQGRSKSCWALYSCFEFLWFIPVEACPSSYIPVTLDWAMRKLIFFQDEWVPLQSQSVSWLISVATGGILVQDAGTKQLGIACCKCSLQLWSGPGAHSFLDPHLTNSICSQVFGKFSHPSSFQTPVIIDHCKNGFIYLRLFKDLKRMHFKGRKMGCSAGEQGRKTCSQVKLFCLLYASKDTDFCLPFQMFCCNSKGEYKMGLISV